MDLFTLVHVIISLIAIASGLVVLLALIKGADSSLTVLFLVTTVATSATGFGFPLNGFTPALAFGVISLVVLAATIAARYAFRFAGAWRRIYVLGTVFALYLNVFVLVVQSFLKVPALHALAPNGSEPPFAIAQAVVLVAFVWAGVLSVRRFRGAAAHAPLPAR